MVFNSFAPANSKTDTITLTVTPGVVSNLKATRGNGRVTLTWTNPTEHYDSIVILRTSAPTDADLPDGYPHEIQLLCQ